MEKFECVGCGRCCFFDFENFDLKVPTFVTETTIMLSKPTLFVRDFEKGAFDESAIAPHNVFFDELNNRVIVLSYKINSEKCPNLDDFRKCSAYETRPILCREFPCHLMSEDTMLSAGCLHDSKVLKEGELKPALFERYGDCFVWRLVSSRLNRLCISELLKLERNGKIKLSRKGCNFEELMKRVDAAPKIDISEVLGLDLRAEADRLYKEEIEKMK